MEKRNISRCLVLSRSPSVVKCIRVCTDVVNCRCYCRPGKRACCYCLPGKRACLGYGDGTVKLLDLKSGASIFTLSPGKLGHDGEVTCLDCHVTDNVLITGSVDCTALLINTSTGKVMKTFISLHTNDGNNSTNKQTTDVIK